MKTERKEVTVYCLAYNHEKYIAECIESVVNQKTSFSFQLVIHDDASTDNTQKIIMNYQKKYPDIIIPIFQDANQYSKGIKIYKEFIEPSIDTEYIAVCEGDDFWSDNYKLQMQYDYMQNNPDCSLCVHNTERVDEDGTPKKIFFNSSMNDREYDAHDIIEAKGGGLFHTSSFFYRYSDRLNMPNEFIMKGAGDYSLSIYLSTIGKVHYIGKVMSCYRDGSNNSWVQRQLRSIEKQVNTNSRIINYLIQIKELTSSEFNESFNSAISKYEYANAILLLDIKSIYSNSNLRKIFLKESIKFRVKIIIKYLLKGIKK